MTKTFLSAVSAMAIMVAAPAYADSQMTNDQSANQTQAEQRTDQQGSMPTMTQEDIKEGWNDTKNAVSETAEDVKEGTQEAYQNIKGTLVNGEKSAKKVENVQINPKSTAAVLIGQTVYNDNGDRVAQVNDIIMDEDGNASLIVLGDGDFTGLGKTAAFDYDMITNKTAEGDLIAPLTEEKLAQAKSFSYDRSEKNANTEVIPEEGYSVAEMLDSQVVTPAGEVLAEIDNIVIKDGDAQQIIVGFGDIAGVGGQQAVLNYSDLEVVEHDNAMDFQLSEAHAEQFKNYKKTVSN